MKQKILTAILLALTIISCASEQDQGKKSAQQLLKSLKKSSKKGILFGHQDDLAYGIGWKYVAGESDTKRSAGDYPALFGWELGGIELRHSQNLDGVPFDKMRDYAVWVHQNGGVNTFSWHPYSAVDTTKNSWVTDTRVVEQILPHKTKKASKKAGFMEVNIETKTPNGKYSFIFKNHLDQVARFFSSLKTPDGEPIPFIFRPWHEMDGGWFWWGSTLCTPDQLKELFRYTIEYLRDEKGLTNMLVAYSPDRNFTTEEEYLTWYPGDDIVDIIAMDNYYDLEKDNTLAEAAEKLKIVAQYAEKTNKVAALSETGFNKLGETQWFTKRLWEVLNHRDLQGKIAYAMVWRNHNLEHFFLPPPEHPAAEDFKKFTQKENIWLLSDWQAYNRER